MSGKIEIITGCMFSGKSTELLNRLNNCSEDYLLLKPKIDTRYGLSDVSTHSGIKKSAKVVSSLSDAFDSISNIKVIGVDEAQFFSSLIINDSLKLKSLGKRIIIAGLNKDYLNKEFKSVSGLIKIADKLTKLYAVCNKCSAPASRSHRLSKDKSIILLGHKDAYEPLCKKCYENAR
tara:strand:+ start:221 stop:751 length:531 start_codon:yes stop_codon:yes gene_type:complete